MLLSFHFCVALCLHICQIWFRIGSWLIWPRFHRFDIANSIPWRLQCKPPWLRHLSGLRNLLCRQWKDMCKPSMSQCAAAVQVVNRRWIWNHWLIAFILGLAARFFKVPSFMGPKGIQGDPRGPWPRTGGGRPAGTGRRPGPEQQKPWKNVPLQSHCPCDKESANIYMLFFSTFSFHHCMN